MRSNVIVQIGACKEEDCLEVCHTVVYINYYKLRKNKLCWEGFPYGWRCDLKL